MAEAPSAVDAPQEDTLEIMGAYPDTSTMNWSLAAFCDRLTWLIDKDVMSRTLPADTSFQQAMSLIIAKSRDDARAVIRLSKAGYGLQAAGLSRSLVEAAINSVYIQGDPEPRGEAYLKSIRESQKRLAKRLTPHSSREEIQRVFQDAKIVEEESKWPGMLKQRVDALGGSLYLYDVVYLMLSQILHNDVAAAAGRLSVDETGHFSLMVGRSNAWVQQALATCFIGLHQVAQVSFDAFALSRTQLDASAKPFEEFTHSLKNSNLNS
jgi:hypothetical protein